MSVPTKLFARIGYASDEAAFDVVFGLELADESLDIRVVIL